MKPSDLNVGYPPPSCPPREAVMGFTEEQEIKKAV